MNIFVLDPNPAIAASYHCDQHLGKMILESAQMLSTAARHYGAHFEHYFGYYKPTHLNHPCNEWLRESLGNCAWVVHLCHELDDIRMSLGADSHKSMDVIKQFTLDFSIFSAPIKPIFCGPAIIKLNPRYPDVPSQYKKYYRQKCLDWLDTRTPMSYKGRPVPDFLSDLPVRS